MKLVAQIKLLPTAEQRAYLLHTLEVANAACNYASERAWETLTFARFPLHRLCYYDIRSTYGLGSSITQLVFAKVAYSYKTCGKKRICRFKPHTAFPYDPGMLSFNLAKSIVSIWTMHGREKMPFVCGNHQRQLLSGLRGECDLVYRNREFYLFQTCDVSVSPEIETQGFIGIDLGIVNIATDSDGHVYQGKAIANVRFRHRRLRAKLQRKGTKSSRRRLKKLSGKERRFATNTNHCLSKQLVQTAKDTERGIALEDLTHIRKRVTATRGQRERLHTWSFYQLRAFVTYKARRIGIPVVLVDPRNTSRTCPACGHVDKRNRPSQSKFCCVRCGFAGLADHIAAVNISRRAADNQPNVSTTAAVSS